MPDYIPDAEADAVNWYFNFQQKLPTHQTALGLVAADMSQVNGDWLLLQASFQSVILAKQEWREWVAFKDTMWNGPIGAPTPAVPGYSPIAISVRPPGIWPRLRALVQRIDAAPGCTDAIRIDLGIKASAVTPPSTVPSYSLLVSGPYSVTLKFAKRGFDGVDIESQRNAESAWEHIAFDGYSPYVDARDPLVAGASEQRRYRIRYRQSDAPVGVFSPVQSINVGP